MNFLYNQNKNMMESSSGSFTPSPSPSFLFSQMSDPTQFITNLAAPFLNLSENNSLSLKPETFGSSFRSLIPNIKKPLLSNDTIASCSLLKLIRMSIDNLGEEGLNIVTNEILPQIVELYLQNSKFIDYYCQCLTSIPAKYRDNVLVDIITKYSMSNDYRYRVLGASLISLVRRHNRVISQFKNFSTDKNKNVRITIIKSLPNCNFDGMIIDSIVEDAAHDMSCDVKNAIACEIGYIAPHLTDLYIELLNDLTTQESALSCFSAMVNYSGFSIFFEPFFKIVSISPEKAASSLIQISAFVDPSEHRLLYKCAKSMRNNKEFISSFFQFTRAFSNREKFLKFFDIRYMKGFRERLLYCQQCQYFVEDFGVKLLPIALEFANDSSKAVRAQSVFLLTDLVKKVPDSKTAVLSLVGSSWMQRVVLANVCINIVGNKYYINNNNNSCDSSYYNHDENEKINSSPSIPSMRYINYNSSYDISGFNNDYLSSGDNYKLKYKNWNNDEKSEKVIIDFLKMKKRLEKDKDPRVRAQFELKQLSND